MLSAALDPLLAARDRLGDEFARLVAAPRGAKRAKVALARRLAVILHRRWVDGIDFLVEPA